MSPLAVRAPAAQAGSSSPRALPGPALPDVIAAQRRGQSTALVAFFALAFALSWAAWVPAALASHGLLTWDVPSWLSRLVGAFGPSLAALLVAARAGGPAGLRVLLGRFRRWRLGVGWYALALLWPTVHSLATTGLLVLLGTARPDFAHPPVLWLYPLPPEAFAGGPWPLLPVVFVQTLLLSSPMGEEPGWRGFALPRLQARLGAFAASVVLGVLWGVWHLPLTLIRDDATAGTFSGWFLLGITGDAVLYTWLFNHTRGSLLPVLLLHAATGTTGLFLSSAQDSGVVGAALTWLPALVVTAAEARPVPHGRGQG